MGRHYAETNYMKLTAFSFFFFWGVGGKEENFQDSFFIILSVLLS